MLTTKAPCSIRVNSRTAPLRLREIAERFTADATDPAEYKCIRCGLHWESDFSGSDYQTVTCSNCYSDSVIITLVRLGFEDWGEQNGGAAEQRKRYENAKRVCAPAIRAVDAIREIWK